MSAFNQHVAGDGQLHAGGWVDQCAVVAHPQCGLLGGAGEVAGNQVKFGHPLRIHPSPLSALSDSRIASEALRRLPHHLSQQRFFALLVAQPAGIVFATFYTAVQHAEK